MVNTATTNAQGKVTLKLEEGRFEAVVSKEGYESYPITENITEDYSFEVLLSRPEEPSSG